MIKRTVAVFLTVLLLLGVLPQIAVAAPEMKLVTVKHPQGTRSYGVYTNGYGDLLFSGEDLETLTDFYYENNGKTARFTRGSKVVEIDLNKGKYTPLKGVTNLPPQEFISEPVKNGDCWYFSAASLLPWLNVHCTVKGGALEIYPDEYSFWDVWGALNPSEYWVSYGDLIWEFEWDSKVVKAMNYTNDHLGEKLLEGVGYTDEYDGSAKDYYHILEGLLLDSSHSEYLAEDIHEKAALGIDVVSLFFDGLDPIFTAFQLLNDGVYYASQYAAFTANHTDKMELIETMSLNRDYYSKQLSQGVLLVDQAYSSWWDQILTKYVLNADKYLVEEIKGKLVENPIGKAILLAVDVNTKEIQNLNERIGLMAPYANLFDNGNAQYKGVGTHYSIIATRRSHGILAMYAAGENLRTLAAYSSKHGKDSLADTYTRMANECDGWIRRLTAASAAEMNDSHCYWQPDGDDEGSKDIYSNKLLDSFEALEFYTPPAKGTELVEYAMLQDFAAQQPGALKTVVFENGGEPGLVLYGGKAPRLFQFEAYASRQDCRLYDLKAMPEVETRDLSDLQLNGSGSALLAQLDSYFAQRENFYQSKSADLNGDGAEDRVYAVLSSAMMWLKRMEIISSQVESNPFGTDPAITLVVAETAPNGLRVRVMRIPIPQDTAWALEGGVLTVGGTKYQYQKAGAEPFVPEAPAVNTSGVPLSRLLLRPYEEVKPMLSGYSELVYSDGETILGKGFFNGAQLEVRFEKKNGTFRVENLEAVFGEQTLDVTSKLKSSASFEAAKESLQPGGSWTLKDSKTEGDAVFYFHNGLCYEPDTDAVWLVTIRTKTVWENEAWGDRTFAGIEFFYSENIDPKVAEALKGKK